MLAGINVSDIYIITTGFLPPQINIHQGRENIQNYMFDFTDYNNISMDSYKQEMFTTFMLEDCVFITCSLNLANVEVISNIQC